MSRIAPVVLLAAVLTRAAPAEAQTPPPPAPWVFTAVDDVELSTNSTYGVPTATLVVKGILQGQTEPVTVSVQLSKTFPSDVLASCERMALLAMTKPGAYHLLVSGSPNGSAYQTRCRLTRAVP